jgi:eukaryotic-like serine/threonine-protein kinase
VSRPRSRDSAPPDLPGYRFIRHLGVGGNAQVYLYEQDLPHREVAVKVLNESALSEAARSRFTAEANVTAGLAHRHIVQVFDAKVTNDGRPYIVMPYYPQANLFVRARRAHMSVAEVLRVGIQIGSAVETSHRRGVLHRDIKPQNILTDSYGEPALTDFGIATTKGEDGPEGLSVPWSPPEILYGSGTGDVRSDVYSLGATLWHLLVGRSPFEQAEGDNKSFALMGRIKSDPVPPTGRADVPDHLERLLRQAMAKDPAARPQTAMELIGGLQSVEQELRLPVTQPILPASDPGDRRGDDTVVSPASRNETFSRGYADEPTHARGPRRLDPWMQAAGGQEQQTQAGNPPVRPYPWDWMPDGGSGGRARQFPPEAPEPATLARPRPIVAADGAGIGPSGTTDGYASRDAHGRTQAVGLLAGDAGRQRRARSGRMLALSGGGVLLATVVVVAVTMLSQGHGGSAAGTLTTQPGNPGDVLPMGPGQLVVSAHSVGGQQVEFSWKYNNPTPGDSFHVQVYGGNVKTARPKKPDLVLSVTQGQQVCIQVEVITTAGMSSQSSVTCWPKS